MIKDIVETIIKELQNEKNKEQVYLVMNPLLYKIKIFSYIIIFLILLILLNLLLTNSIIYELYKIQRNVQTR